MIAMEVLRINSAKNFELVVCGFALAIPKRMF